MGMRSAAKRNVLKKKNRRLCTGGYVFRNQSGLSPIII